MEITSEEYNLLLQFKEKYLQDRLDFANDNYIHGYSDGKKYAIEVIKQRLEDALMEAVISINHPVRESHFISDICNSIENFKWDEQ